MPIVFTHKDTKIGFFHCIALITLNLRIQEYNVARRDDYNAKYI